LPHLRFSKIKKLILPTAIFRVSRHGFSEKGPGLALLEKRCKLFTQIHEFLCLLEAISATILARAE